VKQVKQGVFEMVTFRIYPNGEVVIDDDFEEYDNASPYYDDYSVHEIPDEIVEYLTEI